MKNKNDSDVIERFLNRRDERLKNRQYKQMYERVTDPIDSSDFGKKRLKTEK